MLNTGKLAGKTLYISGASRGIGLDIAKKAARDGANVVIAAKTAEPHPKLPGTIYTAAQQIEDLGGKALPVVVDVRSETAVQDSVEQSVKKFGGIDIVINNASAISLTGTQETPMKTYDLMHQINTRGTYLVSKCCLPYLKESAVKGRNPHILNNSPPLSMRPIWFKNHVAYTMAKYGMSMCVLGMAEELREAGIAVNAIWPRTAIMTAAMEMLGGGGGISTQCRTPQIMADAAYVILTKDSRSFTGNFCIDDQVLSEVGVKDFSQYLAPGATPDSLMPDFFLDEFLEHSGGAERAEEIVAQAEKPAAVKTSVAGSDPVAAVFSEMSGLLNEDLVKKTNAVFSFSLSDKKTQYFLDLKNGGGACGEGNPSADIDATLTMTSANFQKMFSGKLKPTAAFMSGRLKISGNMGKAMKLEKLMGKMQTRSYSTGAEDPVDALFTKISGLLTEDLVKKTDSVFCFSLTDQKSEYFLDLKNGTGSCGKGKPSTDADATLSMTADNFNKMFAGQLKPANAFMSGKLKISGNMGKAMKLEKLMGALQSRGYHTATARDLSLKTSRGFCDQKAEVYTEVAAVFERIKSVTNKAFVKKINAVYVFDIEGEGKWHVDLKNGGGSIGSGDPNAKPDVTIVLQKEVFLKMFNRELKPANAFMKGEVKLSGDLSKAMALEAMMKSTREK